MPRRDWSAAPESGLQVEDGVGQPREAPDAVFPTAGYAYALASRRQFPEPERVSTLLIDFIKR